jgi:hypothetical protein
VNVRYLHVAPNSVYDPPAVTLATSRNGKFRVTVFNSEFSNGCCLPNFDSFQNTPSDLSPCIKRGEVNRVVLTQMDICFSDKSLVTAQLLIGGVAIPSIFSAAIAPTTFLPVSTTVSAFAKRLTRTAAPFSISSLSFADSCPFPSTLDYCGFCSTSEPFVCTCTSQLQANNACIVCDNNSTAINTGLRLCVPNDSGVTGLAGPYMVFDIEIDLVMEAFATIPNVVFPGRLDVNGVLLDCNCVLRGPCDCLDPTQQVDVCGVCTSPTLSGSNCTCTPSQSAAGICIVCPIGSSGSSDSVRLCHPVIPGVYELIDISRCNVRDQLALYPGTVYPGFFGVDASGQPLALDCFCQPPVSTTTTQTSTPAATTTIATTSTVATTTGTSQTTSFAPTTTPAVGFCLNVSLPCDGVTGAPSRADTNGVYCIPTANSSLTLLIGCNQFGTSFSTYSCPFGCNGVCFQDDSISTSLHLSSFDGRLGGAGFCAAPGILPLLPIAAQMKCVPGSCVVFTSVISTTTVSTRSATTIATVPASTIGTVTSNTAPTTTTSAAATTTAPQTTVPSSSCLILRQDCVGSTLANVSFGGYCSIISLPQQRYSFRLSCSSAGALETFLCSELDCNQNCTSSPTILALIGLDTVDASGGGACTTTNVNIPGLTSARVFVQCASSCFTTTVTTTTTTVPPTTAPPLLLPPVNQVPPVIQIPVLSVPSDPQQQDQPQQQQQQQQEGGGVQTDLLAIIGVPSAILIVTLIFFATQNPMQPTPKYYPQRI